MSSTYCTRSDIETVFGTDNVSQWGDLNNTGVGATILARITWAIGHIGDDFDSIAAIRHLRIPIQDQDGSTPTFVRDLAAMAAGVLLYEGRGVEDVDREGNFIHRLAPIRDRVYRTFEQIRRGEREIPGAV